MNVRRDLPFSANFTMPKSAFDIDNQATPTPCNNYVSLFSICGYLLQDILVPSLLSWSPINKPILNNIHSNHQYIQPYTNTVLYQICLAQLTTTTYALYWGWKLQTAGSSKIASPIRNTVARKSVR